MSFLPYILAAFVWFIPPVEIPTTVEELAPIPYSVAIPIVTYESQKRVRVGPATAIDLGDLGSLPLLTWPDDFTYQGAFKFPTTTSGGNEFSFTFIGGMAYDPTDDTLLVTGKDGGYTCRLTIPTPVINANMAFYAGADYAETCMDPTEGYQYGYLLCPDSNPSPTQCAFPGVWANPKIGGIMLNDAHDTIFYSMYEYFLNSNPSSHFRHSRNFSTPSFQGLFRLGDSGMGVPNSAYLATNLTNIPTAWQSALGGDALASGGGIPIISRICQGHCVYAFNTSDVHTGTSEPITVNKLLIHSSTSGRTYDNCTWSGVSTECGYTSGLSTVGGYADGTERGLNGTSTWNGFVFPKDTRTVIIGGFHGDGYFCYGTPINTENPTAQPCPPDYVITNHGTHSNTVMNSVLDGTGQDKYVYKMWFYDALEMAEVKAGTRNEWDVQPYLVVTPTFYAGDSPNRANYILGMAYDSAGKRLFISRAKMFGYQDSFPIVEVYTCTGCP